MNTQALKMQQLLDENAISEEEFANCIGITIAQAEAICHGKKALSKALARQIEQTFSKPAMWLDVDSSDNEGPNYDLFG